MVMRFTASSSVSFFCCFTKRSRKRENVPMYRGCLCPPAGAPSEMNLSHVKVTGSANWGKGSGILRLIQEGFDEGLDTTWASSVSSSVSA